MFGSSQPAAQMTGPSPCGSPGTEGCRCASLMDATGDARYKRGRGNGEHTGRRRLGLTSQRIVQLGHDLVRRKAVEQLRHGRQRVQENGSGMS